jgi:hypothetical protein
MAELKDKYVVEYSVKGGTTHIHTVKQMLDANLRAVMEGRSNDYIPVTIVDSPEDANDQASYLEEQLAMRKGRK